MGTGTLGGLTLGALAPVALAGPAGRLWAPVGGAVGALGGAALMAGYVAARRLEVPLTDALLVSLHGASGTAAGLGFGLWLGDRGSPQWSAALGILAGTATGLLGLAVSPWLKARPGMLLGAASGGTWGAVLGWLGAGMLGKDLLHSPEQALGYALLGQGLGVVLGTVLPAGTGVGMVDVAALDVGGALGAALASAAVLFAPVSPNPVLGHGAVVMGAAGGAAGGLLLSLWIPRRWEKRLEAQWVQNAWPIQLKPALPSPTVNPRTGRADGAVVPLLSGVWK